MLIKVFLANRGSTITIQEHCMLLLMLTTGQQKGQLTCKKSWNKNSQNFILEAQKQIQPSGMIGFQNAKIKQQSVSLYLNWVIMVPSKEVCYLFQKTDKKRNLGRRSQILTKFLNVIGQLNFLS